MIRALLVLIILCFVTPVLGQATLPVEVPTAEGVTISLEHCETLRVDFGAHPGDWTNPVCASMMTRAGVAIKEIASLNQDKRDTINTCTSAAELTFETERNAYFSTHWPVPFTPNSCGDGIIFIETEACDDGVQTATCDIDCTTPICGDGIFNELAGEACDDFGTSATCNADCTLSICGDGIANAEDGESCDDGNTTPGDGCDENCKVEDSAGIPTDVNLAWNTPEPPDPSINGYRVYVRKEQDLYSWGDFLTVTGLTVTISGLEPCTTYSSIARAVNDAGQGPYSNEVSYKPDLTCDC